MEILIDLELIIKQAKDYQENENDISFPFYRAFHDLHPEAGDFLCNGLKNNFKD